VAGVTGEQVEFTVGSDEICSGLVLWWWRYADGSGRRFFPLERDRMFVVDVEGVALLIEISTPDPDDWDAFLPEAEAVLATLEFG
jgi:hypothetical protein